MSQLTASAVMIKYNCLQWGLISYADTDTRPVDSGSWLMGYWWDTHTHTRLTSLFQGLPRWAGTRKVKPVWILLKQETVSGSGFSWAMCKSAPHSRQITTPAVQHPTTQFFTGWMPFLPPNQQRQSTEGKGYWWDRCVIMDGLFVALLLVINCIKLLWRPWREPIPAYCITHLDGNAQKYL